MKRTALIILLALLAAGTALAQSEWEGTTAMGRYGEFPSSGYYGASNSFPRNTLVEVENVETGRTATVLIVDRLDDPGLFLLLSREAAEELGIEDDQVVRSRVVLADNSNRLAVENEDRPFSPDPDVNPGADEELAFLDRYLAEEPEETAPVAPPAPPAEEPVVSGGLIVQAEPEEEPEVPAEEAPEEELATEPELLANETELLGAAEPDNGLEPEVAEPDLPPTELGIVVAPEPEAAETPAAPPQPAGPFIEELYAQAPPQAVLDVPLDDPDLLDRVASERSADNLAGATAPEDAEELAVADLPPTPEARERERILAEQFPLPVPPYDGEEEEFAAAEPMLIEEARPAAVAEAEEPAVEPAAPVEEPEGQVALVLEPAEERPPEAPAEEEAESEPAVVEAPAAEPTEDVSVSARLNPEYHYLQLGVYSSQGSAQTTAARFSSVYPVMVLNQDNALYKVLVGPLSPDESGALLLNFRAQGFRDAFIRKGY